jgi:hypothetical protein
MGLPVPKDMDGRFLDQAFIDGYLDAYPVCLSDASDTGETDHDPGGAEGEGYTEEGEKEILERLRGLGYMG